jgi:hypothetical protein
MTGNSAKNEQGPSMDEQGQYSEESVLRGLVRTTFTGERDGSGHPITVEGLQADRIMQNLQRPPRVNKPKEEEAQ